MRKVHISLQTPNAITVWKFLKWRLESNLRHLEKGKEGVLQPYEAVALMDCMQQLAEAIDDVNAREQADNEQLTLGVENEKGSTESGTVNGCYDHAN